MYNRYFCSIKDNDMSYWVKFSRELLILLVAFGLTTFVGGYFQDRSWQRQRDDDLLQAELRLAENTFSEISSIMDDRLYQIKEVLLSYKQNKKNVIGRKLEEYDAGTKNWNKNINKNFALLDRYFGVKLSELYRKKIFGTFQYLDLRINELRYKGSLPNDEIKKVESELDLLSRMVYEYDLKLLDALKNKNVGQFIEKEGVQHE